MTFHFRVAFFLLGLLLIAATAISQEPAARTDASAPAVTSSSNRAIDGTPANVLTPAQWRRGDVAVNRGLNWLSSQQRSDGSFQTLDSGQPAVSSLCMMAFIAHGHVPGKGQYGTRLERAADFILSCQKPNGLVTKVGPDGPTIDRQTT